MVLLDGTAPSFIDYRSIALLLSYRRKNLVTMGRLALPRTPDFKSGASAKFRFRPHRDRKKLVPPAGLAPAHLSAPDPKSGVSTGSTMEGL